LSLAALPVLVSASNLTGGALAGLERLAGGSEATSPAVAAVTDAIHTSTTPRAAAATSAQPGPAASSPLAAFLSLLPTPVEASTSTLTSHSRSAASAASAEGAAARRAASSLAF